MSRNAAESPVLLDVHGVAALLDVSPRSVFRLADAGILPPGTKLGALRRWPKADILAWVQDGCRPVRTIASRRA
ncbi:MAG: helix-turn-helix domain-containing protein [Phycisphaerales bacterium]|nr:helix-turn-helix domain-containing protein [Phycisphaerales bacterium]